MKGCQKVGVCSSFIARMRGLFSRRAAENDFIILVPCHAVHTLGMRGPIDVAFVGEDGRVMDSVCGVAAGRRLRCRGAQMVVERMASDESWFELDDSLFARPGQTGEGGAR